MARARNIKPGFFKNEDLAECSLAARLCFAGLWTLADRDGRLEDRPKRIKAELFAFDNFDADPLLDELAARGFIVRYQNDDGRFIQIINFVKHQTPHYSEKPSVIKPPGFQESKRDEAREDPGTLPEHSEKQALMKRGAQPPDSLNPDSLIPSSPKKKRAKPRAAPVSVPVDVLLAAGFDGQTAADFLAHKAGLKAPLTDRAWADHCREATKAGWTPLQAAEKVMAKGWKGFEAKYVEAEIGRTGARSGAASAEVSDLFRRGAA